MEFVTILYSTVILYVVVVISLRILGKRQIGQLEPNELVVMLMISELAALPMQDPELPIWHSFLSISILVIMEIILSIIMTKSIKARKLICGKPAVVMHNGQLLRDEMKKNRVTSDEMIEELRRQNITDMSTVQYAILETNGMLSTILYPEHQPATLKDINKQGEIKGLPTVLINDGRWLDDNLKMRNTTRDAVIKELALRQVKNLKDVFLLTLDEMGNYYLSTVN